MRHLIMGALCGISVLAFAIAYGITGNDALATTSLLFYCAHLLHEIAGKS